MTREQRFENRQWSDTVRDVKRAYDQISDLDWRLYEGEPEKAAKHLHKALDDFNAAMTHVAKADVGEAQQGAVDDVNDGIQQLSDAVTALDNGDVDSAQSHYDKAAAAFADAELILA